MLPCLLIFNSIMFSKSSRVAQFLMIWHWFSLLPCGGQWAVGGAKGNHVGTEKRKLGWVYLTGNVELLCTPQNNLHRVHVERSVWCVMTHPATSPRVLSITSILCASLHSHTPQRRRDWNHLMNMDHKKGKDESFMPSSFIISVKYLSLLSIHGE